MELNLIDLAVRTNDFKVWLKDLEKKTSKTFKVIFFQEQCDRVGHSWHEPSIVCSLYDITPTDLLIVTTRRQYSEFCSQFHKALGVTYRDIESIKNGSHALNFFKRSQHQEITFDGRLIIPGNNLIWKMIFESHVGARRGLVSLVHVDSFSRYRSELATRYKIAADSKIVVLHVRDSGWTGSGYHDYRNADIQTYLLAVNYLLELGHLVVRIGDKTMSPLRIKSEMFIDLPHSKLSRDGDDAIFISMCDFYIGQTSGPYSIAALMNKDILLTNEALPFIGRFPIKDCAGSAEGILLVLPKKKVNASSGAVMDILEFILSDGFYRAEDYSKAGIQILNNSEHEILDAVGEFLEIRGRRDSLDQDDILARSKRFMDLLWMVRGMLGRPDGNFGRPSPRSYISKQCWLDIERKYSNLLQHC